MRRVLLCVLSSCVLASLTLLGGPAKAGESGGYYAPGTTRVWYSSSCCYRRIVRNSRSVRYVRVARGYRSPPASDYRPYRDDRAWRYDRPPYGPGYGAWLGGGWYYANYVPPPDCRLVRITDGMGGWMWSRRAGCL